MGAAAPGAYLVACLAAVRAVLIDHSNVGIAGILPAAGLIPAFAIPAVFTVRRARIAAVGGELLIDGSKCWG